ncbi:MAG: glycoside hydrolase family 1 protein [Pseudomonadota bacterium]|jgi:beta-glucosidase
MNDFNFPSDFRFGVADADLQTIGEDAVVRSEQAEPTMWSAFARSGRTHNSDGPGVGVDRYGRWKEDAQLMIDMGVRHYRTSIAMNRILKKNGEVNGKAVEWYQQYWRFLRDAGCKVYATLYHWELPNFLHLEGGWTNRRTVDFLVKHGRVVRDELGSLVEEFFTINEPWCAAMKSYHHGGHAPGVKDLSLALSAAHNLLLASGILVRELKSGSSNVRVGAVFNSEAKYAATSSAADLQARTWADCYFNRWFYDAVFLGSYPEDVRELYGKAWPKISDGDMETIRSGHLLHALGVNNYCGQVVKADPNQELGYSDFRAPEGPINDLGWPITVPPHYPSGLYDILLQIYHSYREHGLKRIYITENGLAYASRFDAAGGLMPDMPRIEYMRSHLSQISAARQAGVPIEGYFAWTLLDNYEWEEGYRPESCFGLVHVDRSSLKRTVKASGKWYSEIMRGAA